MNSLRLLPVVILAGATLLLFKAVGLVSGDGYILGGTQAAIAAGPAPAAPAAATGGSERTLSLPEQLTLEDTSPEVADTAPTLPSPGGTGAPSADSHGAPAASSADHSTAPAPQEHAAAGGDHSAPGAGAIPGPEEDPRAEPLPLLIDGDGLQVPFTATGPDGTPLTEVQLLERLDERRVQLQAWETELGMRLALVEAAEKRLEERSAALADLEARINAMVEQKQAAEEGQLAALVSMYGTMKPRDAARIFDQLDINVLVRVVRGISPRKMAPILAAMEPARAQAVTLALAADEPSPTIDVGQSVPQGLAALPQIVGQ